MGGDSLGVLSDIHHLSALMVKHFDVLQILIWPPATKHQKFALVRCYIIHAIYFGNREHRETAFGREFLFELYLFPAERLLSKVEAFDCVKGLAVLHPHWLLAPIDVDETLERVKVPAVPGDESARVTPWEVHSGHVVPSVIKHIKLFAICYHLVLVIAPADNIDKSVLKVIMGCETGPAKGDGRQFLNLVGAQVELEHIGYRGGGRFLNVVT